jgi:hypothetical protein
MTSEIEQQRERERERDLTGGSEDARCFGRLPTTVLVFLQAKGASQSKLSFGGTSTELTGKQSFLQVYCSSCEEEHSQ